jgi:hypothetical protein
MQVGGGLGLLCVGNRFFPVDHKYVSRAAFKHRALICFYLSLILRETQSFWPKALFSLASLLARVPFFVARSQAPARLTLSSLAPTLSRSDPPLLFILPAHTPLLLPSCAPARPSPLTKSAPLTHAHTHTRSHSHAGLIALARALSLDHAHSLTLALFFLFPL